MQRLKDSEALPDTLYTEEREKERGREGERERERKGGRDEGREREISHFVNVKNRRGHEECPGMMLEQMERGRNQFYYRNK